MALKPDCLFCKIIKGEIPAAKIYENDRVLGFKDISPVAPIHFLFVPKFHVDSVVGLENFEVMADLFKSLVEVAKKEGLIESGFRSVINTGREGGQTVFHLHVHLIGGQQLNARMS